MTSSWDCAWGPDPMAEDDHGLGCEAGCGEDAAANWDDKGLLSRGGLPYCSMACLLFIFGCEMLDSLPLELRGMTEEMERYTGRAKAVA